MHHGAHNGAETLLVESFTHLLAAALPTDADLIVLSVDTMATETLAGLTFEWLPLVGPVIAAACAPVAQAAIARGVKQLASVVHMGWLRQHRLELWGEFDGKPVVGFPVGPVSEGITVGLAGLQIGLGVASGRSYAALAPPIPAPAA